MRVLVFARQLDASRSGVGTYAANLIRGLQKRGHRLGVAVPAGEVDDSLGASTIPLRLNSLDPTPNQWVAAARAFSRALQEHGREYDIAHFVDAREAYFARRSPLPIVGTVNDTYAIDWTDTEFPRHIFSDRHRRSLYYAFLRLVEPPTYRRFDGVIANSNKVARQLHQSYQVASGKTWVVHYGIRAPAPESYEALNGRPAILFVGGNFERKGLPALLEALGEFPDRMGDACLHVVGRDRRQEAFARRIRERGLSHRVQLHGWVPNVRVRAMMAGADVFALPSITEGFGIVYLEALATGTPVVASRWSGACEVFAQNAAFRSVDPADPRAIASAIAELWKRGKRTKLDREAREAGALLSAGAMTEATERVYHDILDGTSRETVISSEGR